MAVLRSVAGRVRAAEATALARVHRWRRARLVWRLRLLALWRRTDLRLSVAPDIRIGRRVKVLLAPRSEIAVTIGPQCQLHDDVSIALMGGTLWFGPDVQLRKGTTVMLSGDLVLEGGNIFSFGCVIHCNDRVTLGYWSGSGEYGSIVDSAHFYSEPEVLVSRNTVSSPVAIGYNVFLAPGCKINRGVTIGDYAIVGPNTVVIKDVPRATFVSGVPAREIGPVDLPWERPGAGALER